MKTLADVFTIPKNVGHNKWQINTPGSVFTTDLYSHAILARFNLYYLEDVWYAKYGESIGNNFNENSMGTFKFKNFYAKNTLNISESRFGFPLEKYSFINDNSIKEFVKLNSTHRNLLEQDLYKLTGIETLSFEYKFLYHQYINNQKKFIVSIDNNPLNYGNTKKFYGYGNS